MTNPLARVVMNTIAEKSSQVNKNKKEYYGKVNNLTNKEEDIISRLIKGEKGVVIKDKSLNPISLDEAANRMRNR